jgi:hypothetical protein
MSNAMASVVYGGPVAVLICFIAWSTKRTWRQPPKTPEQARFRAAWSDAYPYVQFGVHIRPDGFIYSNATGRCLGLAAGAKAAVVPSVPVTTLKPATGWAVIDFADGTTHRNMIGLRNLPQAQAQAARFNGQAQQTTSASFKRTRPATLP